MRDALRLRLDGDVEKEEDRKSPSWIFGLERPTRPVGGSHAWCLSGADALPDGKSRSQERAGGSESSVDSTRSSNSLTAWVPATGVSRIRTLRTPITIPT